MGLSILCNVDKSCVILHRHWKERQEQARILPKGSQQHVGSQARWEILQNNLGMFQAGPKFPIISGLGLYCSKKQAAIAKELHNGPISIIVVHMQT